MAALGKRENVEILISLVRERSVVIYDQTSPEHKDAQLLSNLWTSIEDEMNALISGANFTADECRKKGRNLRDTYKKPRNEAVTTKSGQVAATKRKVPWKYTAVLQFLHKFVAPNRTESNCHSPKSPSDNPEEADELLEDESDTASHVDSDSTVSAAATPVSAVSVRSEASNRKQPKKAKPMKKGPSSSLDEAILGLIEDHRQNSEEIKQSMQQQDRPNKDDNESFCTDICSRMRKMSPQIQSFLKYQISTLLFNAENPEFPQMPIPPPPSLHQFLLPSNRSRTIRPPIKRSPLPRTSPHTLCKQWP